MGIAKKASTAETLRDWVGGNHPSIVLWCGNNETEISWNWGRTTAITKDLDAETRRRMWQDYLTLFSGVIARRVYQLAPETPYWPSSPSADYEDLPEGQQSGDEHDWSVWHGRAPFEEYERHNPRFMTEYGFQSFPEMDTVERFTEPADRTSIFTPVMLSHQKNDEGNAIIRDYLIRYFGEPKDFPAFLYLSQVLQAEGVKIGAEHLRRIRPRNMGSIYWQLNDCWPVASWSSIDYYGNWKALQYYARRFYAPILISPAIEDGALRIYAVSDKTVPTPAEIRMRILEFDGKVLYTERKTVTLEPLKSTVYLSHPLSEILSIPGLKADSVVVAADLTVEGKVLSSNVAYLVPIKQVRFPVPHIDAEILAGEPGHYTITLRSSSLARSVFLHFDQQNVTLSDNYVDLLPGEPRAIQLASSADRNALQKAMRIMSIADALASNDSHAPSASVVPNNDWKQ